VLALGAAPRSGASRSSRRNADQGKLGIASGKASGSLDDWVGGNPPGNWRVLSFEERD
jgi:hypothetical protein